jgi:light-regulated signal transduction histidine kinase (bacteriophytochrome)
MAHDLRSPLRALDGFSLAILEDHEACLDEAGSDSLRRIRAASQRMAELLDAQVRLARTGERPVEVEEVDISSLARRVVGGLEARDPSRVVQCTIRDAMTAQTDQVIAGLVLEELLDNSWKFTSSCATARIHVGCGAGADERVFFVGDNGAGFDEAYAHKLFTPFERLHSAEEFAGMGIGLARVRRMLERVGGRCWAEGEPGVGATVWFTLEKDA